MSSQFSSSFSYVELVDENTQLQFATKDLCSSTVAYHSEDECTSGDNSLSEQLTNNAQTRALKLELGEEFAF